MYNCERNPQLNDLDKILFTEKQIQERIQALGIEINNHYQNQELRI